MNLSKYFNYVYTGFKYVVRIYFLLLMNRWFEFYRSYFEMCTIIRKRKSNPEQFRRYVWAPISALIVITILVIIKLFHNCYWNDRNDIIWVKIYADIIADANLHSNANWFLIILIVVCDWMILLLYFRNSTAEHIQSIIIDHRNESFQWPFKYRSMMAIDYVTDHGRKTFSIIFRFFLLLSICVVIVDIRTLEFLYLNIDKIYDYNNQFIGFIRLMLTFINWKLIESLIFVCALSAAISVSISQVFIAIGHVHFWQTEQLLHFNDIIRDRHNNKWLSQIGFNCYLILFIISYHTTLFYLTLITILCLIQMLNIFVIHFQIALINRKFYQSAPIMMSRMATTEFHGKFLQTKLKLSNFAQKMHTNNRYGITYWSQQIVNTNEFAKFLLIYSQLIIKSFI
uniref:Uncharacterized protein LOC113790598 n=1 Tax=Dermatophagoides pteronyssinus TaxID=6956 RepID=A0A6P6XT79_DERPT